MAGPLGRFFCSYIVAMEFCGFKTKWHPSIDIGGEPVVQAGRPCSRPMHPLHSVETFVNLSSGQLESWYKKNGFTLI
jgi:hypothetical protein